MNDRNSGDGRQIQPPPGWLGRPGPSQQPDQPQPGQPPPGQPHPGYPGPDQPGYPPGGYPQPGYGAPGPYGQPQGYPGYQPYANQPYTTGGYGTGGYGAPPPPAPKSRRGLKTVLVLVILAALAGGGYMVYRAGVLNPYLEKVGLGSLAAPATPGSSATTAPDANPDANPDAGAAPDTPDAAGEPDDAGGFGSTPPGTSTTVPGCPFTADQITAMVGQSMVDKGTCLFGDGKGVAQLGIEVHSALSTSATLAYARQRADKQYLLVEDVKNGDKGYIAYKNTAAEAMVVTAQGGYTITMSSFERFNGFTYEEPLMAIVAALPR